MKSSRKASYSSPRGSSKGAKKKNKQLREQQQQDVIDRSPERYANQKRATKELSKPSPLKKVSPRPQAPPREMQGGVHSPVREGNVPEMHVDGIAPVRRANDGLHMVHEHPVITRDQPLPPVQRPVKISASKVELDLKGWGAQTVGTDFLSVAGGDSRLEKQAALYGEKRMTQRFGTEQPIEEADSFAKSLQSINSVEGFNNYSQIESDRKFKGVTAHDVREDPRFHTGLVKRDKSANAHQTGGLCVAGSQPSSRVTGPSPQTSRVPSKRATERLHDNIPLGGGISILNYQQSNERDGDSAKDVVQRMHKDAVEKERKRNQSERRNKDLLQLSPRGAGASSRARNSALSSKHNQRESPRPTQRSTNYDGPTRGQVVFEDQNIMRESLASSKVRSPTMADYNGHKKGILKAKTQSKERNDEDVAQSENMNDEKAAEDAMKIQQAVGADELFVGVPEGSSITTDSDPSDAPVDVHHATLQSRLSRATAEQMMNSTVNSKHATAIQKHRKGRKKILKRSKAADSDRQSFNATLTQNLQDDLAAMSINDCFRDDDERFGDGPVEEQPRIDSVLQKEEKASRSSKDVSDLQRRMMIEAKRAEMEKAKVELEEIHKTPMEKFKEDMDARMRSIVREYTKKFSSQKASEEADPDSSRSASMPVLDDDLFYGKPAALRRLLQKQMEREKQQYGSHPVLQQISDAMTYSEEQFQARLEAALHPKNSPIPPAEYVRNVADDKEPEKLADEQKALKETEDKYRPVLPLTQQFIGRQRELRHMETMHALLTGGSASLTRSRSVDTVSGDFSSPPITRLMTIKEEPHAGTQFSPMQLNIDGGVSPDSEALTSGDEEIEIKSKEQETPTESSEVLSLKQLDVLPHRVINNIPRRDSVIYTNLALSNQESTKKLDLGMHNRGNSEHMEGMKQVEKVFQMIHDYCSENLQISNKMLDRHINDLLDPTLTVSPLLKYFNELARYCYFRLPCMALLELDQKFFRAYLNKYRKAQKEEVRWVKSTITAEARKTLMKAFDGARELMQKEFKHVHWQHDQLKKQVKTLENTIDGMKAKMNLQAQTITQQKAFVATTISKIYHNDKDLYLLNGGAGGAYETHIPGNVIQNIVEYNSLLKLHCEEEACAVIAKLEKQRGIKKEASKIQKGFAKGLLGRVRATQEQLEEGADPAVVIEQGLANLQAQQAAHRRTSVRDVASIALGISQSPRHSAAMIGDTSSQVTHKIEPLEERFANMDEQYQKYTSIREHPLFQMDLPDPKKLAPWEKLLPLAQEHVYPLEPLLSKKFALYSGSVSLQMEDVSTVVSEELYKYYKVRIANMIEEMQVLRTENDTISYMMSELSDENKKLKMQNLELQAKVDQLISEFRQEREKIRLKSEEEIAKMKEQCAKEVWQTREFFLVEIKVANAITEKMKEETEWQREKLRKFATILRVPRLHFEYIEKNGVDEFVDYCESIVKRERAMQDQRESKQEQLELRKQLAVKKMLKRYEAVDFAEYLQEKKIEGSVQEPFEIPVKHDLRREDHVDHKKEREKEIDAKIMKRIEQINWLKTKSVLDLAELIDMHKGKQPQLLAAIMPDIQNQLLTNPHFFKNLEQLERQDPINKKVREVRNFVTSLKASKFEQRFHLNNDLSDVKMQQSEKSPSAQDRRSASLLQSNDRDLNRSINFGPSQSSLGIATENVPRKGASRLLNQSMDLRLENASAHRRYQSLRASLNSFTPSAIRTEASRRVNYEPNTVNKSHAFRTIDAGMPRRLFAGNTSPKLINAADLKDSRFNTQNILPAIGSINTTRDKEKEQQLNEEPTEGDLITIELEKANLQVPQLNDASELDDNILYQSPKDNSFDTDEEVIIHSGKVNKRKLHRLEESFDTVPGLSDASAMKVTQTKLKSKLTTGHSPFNSSAQIDWSQRGKSMSKLVSNGGSVAASNIFSALAAKNLAPSFAKNIQSHAQRDTMARLKNQSGGVFNTNFGSQTASSSNIVKSGVKDSKKGTQGPSGVASIQYIKTQPDNNSKYKTTRIIRNDITQQMINEQSSNVIFVKTDEQVPEESKQESSNTPATKKTKARDLKVTMPGHPGASLSYDETQNPANQTGGFETTIAMSNN